MTITFIFQPTFLYFLTIIVGILAIIDGVTRVRGRGGVLPVVAIILGALVLLSAFFGIAPIVPPLLYLLLLIVLVLMLVFRGSVRRGGILITILAIILDAILILIVQGWLHIPGLF